MRFSRRWARRLAISTLAVLGVAVVVPYVVPLGGYIPRIEQAAGDALHQPVHIDALRVHLLPRPHLTAYGVSVGQPATVSIDAIVVTPVLHTLLSDTRVIDDILVERPWVAQGAFAMLGSRPKAKEAASTGAPTARLGRLRIRSGELRLASGTIGAIDVVAMLGDDGVPTRIEVSQAGAMEVTLDGAAGNYTLTAAGRDWRLPVGPPLRFERLTARGTVGPQGIALRTIDGRLYGGSVSGDARLGWKGPWTLEGALAVKDVEIAPVTALFTAKSRLSGRISAQPSFTSTATKPGALADLLHLETSFDITEGVLEGLDLVSAAKSIFVKSDTKDAQTRFDHMSGHLEIDEEGYHLSELSIVSGLLRAEGELSIGRTRTLDGEITTEVRGTASLIATPLAISGTLDDPVVRPTKAALAGAAVGTVILPGIGTAIGARAGQLTKRLFSGGSSRPREENGAGR